MKLEAKPKADEATYYPAVSRIHQPTWLPVAQAAPGAKDISPEGNGASRGTHTACTPNFHGESGTAIGS